VFVALREKLTRRSAAAPRSPASRGAARALAAQDSFGGPQALWGSGFVRPGGPDFIVELLAESGLRPTSLVLDLTAGLGGRARTIAAAFGCFVTGLESDYDTAQRGMALSRAAGMAKQATIRHFNPGAIELRRHSFDCIVADGLLQTLEEKERVLRALREGLRRNGRLVLTELVACDSEGDRWSAEQYLDCLKGLGFVVEPGVDLSDRFQAIVKVGCQGLLEKMPALGLAAEPRAALVGQLEAWAVEIAALEAGKTAYYKFEATVPRRAGRGFLTLAAQLLIFRRSPAKSKSESSVGHEDN
jgi:SAM-dependent methyltransferase